MEDYIYHPEFHKLITHLNDSINISVVTDSVLVHVSRADALKIYNILTNKYFPDELKEGV